MRGERPSSEELQRAMVRLRAALDAVGFDAVASPLMSRKLATGALRRASNVLKAIEMIAALRLPSEVNALGRVLCEMLYDCAWVHTAHEKNRSAKEREEKAQWLVDKTTVEGVRLLHRWAVFGYGMADLSAADGRASSARARQGWTRSKPPEHPNLHDRAKEIGPSFLENYALFYQQMYLDPIVQPASDSKGDDAELELERALFMALGSAQRLGQVCCALLQREDGIGPLETYLPKAGARAKVAQ